MRKNQPNLENAACEREMIFPDISNSFQFQRAQILTCLSYANNFLAKYCILKNTYQDTVHRPR